MITSVLIALTVVVVCAGVAWWVVSSGALRDGGNDRTSEEREEFRADELRDDISIPLSKRYKAYPTALRLALTATVLVGVAAFAAVYHSMQTGRAPSQLESMEAYMTGVGVVSIGVGVWLDRAIDARTKSLVVIEDGEPGEESESRVIQVMDDVDYWDGHPVVKEVEVGLLLERFVQVGEHRQLRKARKLPEDRVEHVLTGDVTEFDDGWIIRTCPGGQEVLDGPHKPDYTYEPPHVLSREDALRIQKQSKQIKDRLDTTRAELANLEAQHERLKKQLENEEWDGEEEAFEQVSRTIELVAQVVNDNQDNGDDSGQSPGLERGD